MSKGYTHRPIESMNSTDKTCTDFVMENETFVIVTDLEGNPTARMRVKIE